jgi:hypothetical protein
MIVDPSTWVSRVTLKVVSYPHTKKQSEGEILDMYSIILWMEIVRDCASNKEYEERIWRKEKEK